MGFWKLFFFLLSFLRFAARFWQLKIEKTKDRISWGDFLLLDCHPGFSCMLDSLHIQDSQNWCLRCQMEDLQMEMLIY